MWVDDIQPELPASGLMRHLSLAQEQLSAAQSLLKSIQIEEPPDDPRTTERTQSGGAANFCSKVGTFSKAERLHKALEIAKARDRRSNFFDESLTGEPSWSILLSLYIADAQHKQLSVSRVAAAASVATTTLLRALSNLEAHRLISRHPSATDRRQSMITVSDEARTRMDNYLADLLAAARSK